MKRKEDLYQLIHKLSPAEYRYVKSDLSFRRNEKTDNVLLLEAFRNQNRYNEKLIKEKFRNKPLVKQFETKKYYLYSTILKSLNSYNYKDFKGEMLISEIEILIRKGLHDQAYRILKSSQKKCERESRLLLAVRFVELEEKLSHFITSIDRLELSQRAQFVMERYQDAFYLKNLYFKIRSNIQKYTYFRTKEHEQEMLKLIEERVLKNNFRESSLIAEAYKNQIRFTYYACLTQWREAKKILLDQEHILEALSETNPDKRSMTLSNLNRLMLCEIALNNREKALERDKEVTDFIRIYGEEQDYFIHGYSSIFYKLVMYVKQRNLEMLEETLHEALKLLDDQNFIKRIGERNLLLLIFEIGKAFYSLGELDKASNWNYKVIYRNSGRTDNQDLFVFSCFVNLLINYEKKYFDLWNTDCQNVRRQMQKHKILYEFERVFINFVSHKLPSADKTELQQFKENLVPLMKGRYNQSIKYYFDFEDWLDRMIAKA